MKRYLLIAMGVIAFTLAGLAQAHRDERLEAVLDAAEENVRARFERSQLLGQVGHKYALIGREEQGRALIADALTIARGIETPLLRDEALAHLANEIASTGDFERAQALYETVGDLEVRTKLGWKLVNKLGKAGHPEQCQGLLDEIIVRVLAVEDDLALRAELLAGTGANHRFTEPAAGVPFVYEAYGIAQSLADPYERGLFFNEIGANLMDIDHPERARRVFERSRGLVDVIESPLEQARYLAMLGGEQAEKGARDAAAGDLEQGVEAARRVPPGEARNDVLSELARNLGQSHRFERGIEVADEIPDLYHRAEGYIRIAKNMHRTGHSEQALQLLQRTEQMAAEIGDPYRRGIVFRKLASEWVSLKEARHAARLLDAAFQAAQALAGVESLAGR